MLKKVRKKIKDESLTLIEGEFLKTEVPNGPFDMVVMSLVLEHIRELSQFFMKTRDLMKPNGTFYFSEIHPARTTTGIMANFKTTNGDEFHLSSFPHTEQEICLAATKSGFLIEEVKTEVGTRDLTKKNAKWEKYLERPMIQIWTLRAMP